MSSMLQESVMKRKTVEIRPENEVTCDCCARLFVAAKRRYYCFHCNKYFHVCPTCVENPDKLPKCRFCGIPLKKKNEGG